MMKSAIVIFLLGILCRSAFAERNFWDNEICRSDDDCSGLNSCNLTFGCTLSINKVALVGLGVFVGLALIITAVVCLCGRHLRNSRFNTRRHNHQYLPQTTVITTNTPAWNQQQMGGVATTTVYPPNPQPNHFSGNQPNHFNINPVNPPPFNPYLAETGLNANQMPNAPYPSAGMDMRHPPNYESKTYYTKN